MTATPDGIGPPAPPDFRASLIALWAATFLTSVGMMVLLPYFPLFLRATGMREEGSIAAWSGWIVGAAPFTAALMGGFWGALGDRIGRKAMLMRAQIGIAVFVGLMALATEPWHLLLLRVGQGVFSGFVAPAVTLMSLLAPPERQGRVGGQLQTAALSGSALGPLLGGHLAESFGIAATAAITAGTALLAWILVAALVVEPPVALRAGPHADGRRGLLALLRPMLAASRHDLKEALLSAEMRALLLVLLVSRGVAQALNPTLVLFVEKLIGAANPAAVRTASLVYAAYPIAILCCSPLLGRSADREPPLRLLRICVACGAVFTAAQAFARTPVELFALRLFAGAAAAGVIPAGIALIARATAAERRGTRIGLFFSATSFGLALGPWAGGMLESATSYRAVALAGGAALLAAFLRLLLAGRLARPAEGA